MIEIREIQNDEMGDWNNILEKSACRTLFHTLEWLNIMEKYSWIKVLHKYCKAKLHPIVIIDNGDIIGIYPIFSYRNFIKLASSPPSRTAVPYLGPIFLRSISNAQYQKEIDSFLKNNLKYNFIKTYYSPNSIKSSFLKNAGYDVEILYKPLIHLNNDLKLIQERYFEHISDYEKMVERDDISLQECNKSEFELFFDNLAFNFEKQNRTPFRLSKDYLIDLSNHFYPKNLKIFVAKHQGKIIGGIIIIYYQDKCLLWLGPPKDSLDNSINDLLLWEAIKWAHSKNYKQFEILWNDIESWNNLMKKDNFSEYLSAKKFSSSGFKFLESIYFNSKSIQSKLIKKASLMIK